MTVKETQAQRLQREADEAARAALLEAPIASVDTEAAKPLVSAASAAYAGAPAIVATPKQREVGIPGWPACGNWAEVVYRGGVPSKAFKPGGGAVVDPLDGGGQRMAVGHAMGSVMRNVEHKGEVYQLTDKDGVLWMGQGQKIRLPSHLALILAVEISTDGEFPVGPPGLIGPDPASNGKRRRSGDQAIDVFIAPEWLASAVAICERHFGVSDGSKWVNAWRHMTIRSIDDGSIIHQGAGLTAAAAGAASQVDVETMRRQLDAQALALEALQARLAEQSTQKA